MDEFGTHVKERLRAEVGSAEPSPAFWGEVDRRAQRRRLKQRGSIAASVAALAVAVGLGGSILELPGPGEFATREAGGGPDVIITLCSDVAATTDIGQRCETPATDQQISRLRSALALDDAVIDVQFETQDQAFERFSELFADEPDVLGSVTPETLAPSLRITLAEDAPIDDIVQHYGQFDGAEAVISPDQG